MANENWTREQTVAAFNLYCRIPFNRVSSNHPEILRLSKIIGRSPNSVKMKIGNFGSFDPELKRRGIVGLANASKLDQEVWSEFHKDWESLSLESETILASFENKGLEGQYLSEEEAKSYEGKEKERLVKTRINQQFFRESVLSAHNNTCCITGISQPELLVASHIVPWSKNKEERLNPANGLCLNALHDKAFHKGLITVNTDFTIAVSSLVLSNQSLHDFFSKYHGRTISVPERFVPRAEFLAYHKQNIFVGS